MKNKLLAKIFFVCYNNGMIPKDAYILLSYANMKLRDGCVSLQALAEAFDVSEEEITEPLAQIGYHYDAETNRFTQ